MDLGHHHERNSKVSPESMEDKRITILIDDKESSKFELVSEIERINTKLDELVRLILNPKEIIT